MTQGFECCFAGAAPGDSPAVSWSTFEARSIQLFRAQGWERLFPLCLGRMAGFDRPESHRFRCEAMEHAITNDSPDLLAALARGLVGCCSESAHVLRLELMKLGVPVNELHAGLIGCDEAPHHALRNKLMEANPLLDDSGCLQGLIGCDSEEALAFRRDLVRVHPALEVAVAESLIGCDRVEAHALRRDLLLRAERLASDRRRILMTGILSGLAGCISPPSIELRWELFAKSADYAAIVRSCIGVWSSGLCDLWECAAAQAPGVAAELLVGIDDPESHVFRRGLFRRGCDPVLLLRGLAGCDGVEAWRVRRELIGALPEPSLAALLPSIARCRSQAAWALRDSAVVAGVPRLVLLEGTVGDGEPLFWTREIRTLLVCRITCDAAFLLFR